MKGSGSVHARGATLAAGPPLPEGAALERRLGDACAAGPFSFAAAVARDESESFPAGPLRELQALGVADRFVPRALGGTLDSLEQLLELGRALARRDPALALSATMSVWTQLAWLAGTEPQRGHVRDLLRAGATPCLAVSEPEHGADLLAGEVTAREVGDGWELDGVKWPIGAAGTASLAFVLARTDPGAGPRSLSWFVLGPDALGSVARLPAARTLGMRAAHVGGLAFRGTRLPPDALLGGRGRGLELTLNLFHITRPLATAFALGAADTALRIAAAFAAGRTLYRRPAFELPNVEDGLVCAFVDLLAAEALARSAVRGLHTHPTEASVGSTIAKVLVPELTGRALRAASEALGARFYLRRGIGAGLFQKLVRDQLVVGLFDGSTGVCLQALAAQLPLLLDGRPRHSSSAEGSARFALGHALPTFDATRLSVGARDDVVVGSLDALALPGPAAGARDAVLEALAELRARLGAHRSRGPAAARSPLPFALARRYAVLHAAAACLQVEAASAAGELPSGWSEVAVRRLLEPDLPLRELVSERAFVEVRQALERAVAAPRTLSLTPTPLCDGPIHDVLPEGIP